MYEIIIETVYNIITLTVDDYKSPKVKEILEQPYVIKYEIHELKNKRRIKRRDFKKCMNYGPEDTRRGDTNI